MSVQRSTQYKPTFGFSMVELLAVMAILSILAGLSVGALAKAGRGNVLDIGVRRVKSALAETRVNAREKGTTTSLTLLPGDPGRLLLRLARDAATLHFDEQGTSKTPAGRNNHASLSQVNIADGGTVRSAAFFKNKSQVVLPDMPEFDPCSGFRIFLDVWAETEGGEGVLARFGNSFQFSRDGDGALSMHLEVVGREEMLKIATPKGVVPAERWARVEAGFDGNAAWICVHGVEEVRKGVAPSGDTRTSWRLQYPLELGAGHLVLGGGGFAGRMDEAHYLTTEEESVIELERGVSFSTEQPLLVQFLADGRLDPRFHQAIVAITVNTAEGGNAGICVDLAGVTR
ncbi:MAG: prepilin-type N-terminal cleavage/methylation domain-containing protein [Planctomycetes bacterium]|nr:prepilin-type N-terminal cleavage/methylation domain-containing protein [Planctomycetota bacterium]